MLIINIFVEKKYGFVSERHEMRAAILARK